ncbi:MAG: (d)CMP kinase [Eubacteriaceae bacterium]|nr:(d)CMP kinase [Eubacteriaceae bacterium]
MKIAVDGPAGAGKSTISKILAGKLKINYLDTGAMYRAATYLTLVKKIALEDSSAIINAVKDCDIDFIDNEIFLNGNNVSEQIRSPEVNKAVAVISRIPEIRDIMVAKQKKIAEKSSVIMDGRDITTIVMPDADYKFYLDAPIDIRAERRFEELKAKGSLVDMEELKGDIAKRDFEDKNRETGPLVVAGDANVIDTSGLSIDEVTERMLNIIVKKVNRL